MLLCIASTSVTFVLKKPGSMHATLIPNGAMFKLKQKRGKVAVNLFFFFFLKDTRENDTGDVRGRGVGMKRSQSLSPQAVIEGLHAVLGHTVRPAERAAPPEHAGHVHHPAPGLLDEGEDAERHVNDAAEIDGEHAPVVVDVEPVGGTGRQSDASIVHHGPQAWRGDTGRDQR